MRRAVQQTTRSLVFQAPYLPAQGGLGHVQGGCGATEVAVFGDGGEVAHQPRSRSTSCDADVM